MLSLVNITLCLSNYNNVSALSYESSIGVGFTFNPTLSISLSSSDLVISNLTPGTTEDSNSINVSVSTNAAYGYTLSATANNNNLIHANDANAFSSVGNNANLETLTTDNTWGYSYKNNLASTPTWSSYSGLSTDVSKVLFNTDNNTSSSIDFKIAAKASSTQPSGVYTGTITFVAVTKPTPMNLAESYFAHGKSRYKGYYTMQDMNTEICNDTEVIGEGSQTELIDIRDDKVYWATKLADNHCWMTQNLDLDLDSNRTYTHWDTDLGWTELDEGAEWRPNSSTATTGGWKYLGTTPFSYDLGNRYIYTSDTDADDIEYTSLLDCITATNDSAGCSHSHLGNYYNWPASVASNDIGLVATETNALSSICAANWKLPDAINNEYGIMLYKQEILQNPTSSYYTGDGFINIRKSPLYFIRGGINGGTINIGISGNYYLSTMSVTQHYPYYLSFLKQEISNKGINAKMTGSRTYMGASVRCVAR